MALLRGVSSVQVGLVLASSALAGNAWAVDTTHIVARGHTLQAIANRYHVTVESIVKANHLTNVKALTPGETLIIPDVQKAFLPKPKEDPKPKDEKSKRDAKEAGAHEGKLSKEALALKEAKEKAEAKKKEKPPTFAMRARTPGVVHVTRIATKEDFQVRLRDGGKVPSSAGRIFERLMRSTTGKTHAIEPRTLLLLANVSDHFGSRKIEIVSGYRPYRDSQATKHSKHNDGKAIDFRVVGVPNEVLRDYCKTLKNVGVGYYPNSVFVHLDARETPAFWIDYSKPGEPPRYHSPDADADEGANDIVEDDKLPEVVDQKPKDAEKPAEPEKPAGPTPLEGQPVVASP